VKNLLGKDLLNNQVDNAANCIQCSASHAARCMCIADAHAKKNMTKNGKTCSAR
jgi:hypothetical protein